VVNSTLSQGLIYHTRRATPYRDASVKKFRYPRWVIEIDDFRATVEQLVRENHERSPGSEIPATSERLFGGARV
jgi:hypothetical protein